MPEFIPTGYISVREALNRLGRELPEWTGEEYKARSGLISEDEWLKTKDLAPARGADAGPVAWRRKTIAAPAATALHSTGDPSSAAYKAEYRARERYKDTSHRLRVLLEAGDLEAAILDLFTGILHPASHTLWRRFDAGRMIKTGEAPIPRSRNTGALVVKEFHMPGRPGRPLSQSKLNEVVDLLREKLATGNLTRAQQKDFVRNRFPTYHVTERQFGQIFKKLPVSIGRPKKSDTKV